MGPPDRIWFPGVPHPAVGRAFRAPAVLILQIFDVTAHDLDEAPPPFAYLFEVALLGDLAQPRARYGKQMAGGS
jgi:hypothetical protein